MTMPFRFLLLFLTLSAAVLFSGGCYDRFTGNYDNVPELSESEMEMEIPEEEDGEEERLRQLEALELEGEEVYTINSGDNVSITV